MIIISLRHILITYHSSGRVRVPKGALISRWVHASRGLSLNGLLSLPMSTHGLTLFNDGNQIPLEKKFQRYLPKSERTFVQPNRCQLCHYTSVNDRTPVEVLTALAVRPLAESGQTSAYVRYRGWKPEPPGVSLVVSYTVRVATMDTSVCVLVLPLTIPESSPTTVKKEIRESDTFGVSLAAILSRVLPQQGVSRRHIPAESGRTPELVYRRRFQECRKLKGALQRVVV